MGSRNHRAEPVPVLRRALPSSDCSHAHQSSDRETASLDPTRVPTEGESCIGKVAVHFMTLLSGTPTFGERRNRPHLDLQNFAAINMVATLTSCNCLRGTGRRTMYWSFAIRCDVDQPIDQDHRNKSNESLMLTYGLLTADTTSAHNSHPNRSEYVSQSKSKLSKEFSVAKLSTLQKRMSHARFDPEP